VHSNITTSTIERVINIFPSDQQSIIRTRLADNLLFVLAQRLVPMEKGHSRVLAHEKLINNFSIKSLIRDSKTHQIRSQMLSGTEEFSSLEASLAKLYVGGLIKFETACFTPRTSNSIKTLQKGLKHQVSQLSTVFIHAAIFQCPINLQDIKN